MGLDIRYYARLEASDAMVSDDADPWDLEVFKPTVNSDFESRAIGVDPNVWYRDEERGHFRAGSYSGYNRWREALADAVGMPSPRDVWDGKVEAGPMYELINFSDCEGTIGPVVSAKLARDFDEQRDRVTGWAAIQPREDREYFLRKYEEWASAFKVAADGGCVVFA